jgi:hypothetical protein
MHEFVYLMVRLLSFMQQQSRKMEEEGKILVNQIITHKPPTTIACMQRGRSSAKKCTLPRHAKEGGGGNFD